MVHSGKEIQREVRSQIKEGLHMPPSPGSRIPLAGVQTQDSFFTLLFFSCSTSPQAKRIKEYLIP